MPGALVEREGELQKVEALLDAAARGCGQVIVVEGAPGAGVTRLLDEIGHRASAAGTDVLSARGVALEEQFTFGVVRQLFEGVLAGASASERRTLLSGAAGAAAALFGYDGGCRPVRPASGSSFAPLHGLFWLCSNLAARKPLLLSIDDAQWADAASLRLFSFLAARLARLPLVLLLGAHRADAPVLHAIRNDRAAVVLELGELSEQACGRVVADEWGRAPAREFCVACWHATGGTPFYLRALLDELAAAGVLPDLAGVAKVDACVPAEIVRSLELRLSRLSPQAAALARTLAVVGEENELRHASAVAELEPDETARAADELVRDAILAPEWPLRCVSPVVERAIRANVPAGERNVMHARFARKLAASGASPERAAAHLLAAEPDGGDPSRVDLLRRAADCALGRGAPDRAIEYLERARRERPRDERAGAVLRELGVAEYHAGHPGAIEHLRQALALARNPDDRLSIGQELASALAFAAPGREAAVVLQTAADGVNGPWAKLLLATALHPSTRALHARELAGLRARPPNEPELLAHLALWSACEGEPAAVTGELAARAVADASEPHILCCAAGALIVSDDLAGACRVLDRAAAGAAAATSAPLRAALSSLRAEAAFRMGDLRVAHDAASAALDTAAGDRSVFGPHARSLLAQVLLERGKLTAGERLVAGAHGEHEHAGMAVALGVARGRLAAARGQWAIAVEEFLRCAAWSAAWGERNPGLVGWRSGGALALAKVGERERAEEMCDELLTLARSLGQPRSLGIALRTAAIISGGPDGVALHRESVRALQDTPARLDHALSLIELGAALSRGNHRKDAREPLRQGIDLARRCEASLLEQRGRAELAAAGARPRRTAIHGVAALTPSERRVAGLAAGGLSTPEIADRLFVSVNTVETHLRRTYHKLGIHSRGQLPQKLEKITTAP